MEKTIKEKVDEIYRIKQSIKHELLNKGFTEAEIGNNLKDIPKLIAKMNIESFLPDWFTNSIVCWYNPYQQKLTNDIIKAGNGQFLLKDLSGNGLDMTMYNFDGESNSGMNYTTNKNSLVFNGINNYGISKNQPILTDYTIMCKREILQNYTTGYRAVASKGGNEGAFAFEYYSLNSMYASSFGSNNIITINRLKSLSVQTTQSYNNLSITVGNKKDKIDNNLLLGKINSNSEDYTNFALYDFILFNRILTQEEIDWVKRNIMIESINLEDNNSLLLENKEELILE